MPHDVSKSRDDFYLSGLSPELRGRLEQKARASERSLTKEMIYRLRRSLEAEETAAA